MRLFSFLGRQNPKAPPGRRNRYAPQLLQLEGRDVPAAQWYTVHIDSPAEGVVGETLASLTSGELHVDSSHDPNGDGTALVYAEDQADAIRQAVTGSVTVDLSALGLASAEYEFGPGTVSTSTGDLTQPFLAVPWGVVLTPTANSPDPGGPAWDAEENASGTHFLVLLEDLAVVANDPQSELTPDYDFNDFFWRVTVATGAEPAPAATVGYDVGAGYTVHNTFVLDQKRVFDDPAYDPNAGPLSIQILTPPMKGVAQIVDGFDFLYTPTAGQTGADYLTWRVLQGNRALGGVQRIDFNILGAPAQTGTGLAKIEFQNFAVGANNSAATLFLASTDGSAPVGTTIDLSVKVSNYANPTDPQQPTGTVIFTATKPGGVAEQIGSAVIGPGGIAAIQVDSQLLAVAGTLVEAEYGGDQFFGIRMVGDETRTAKDLRNDVEINDNTVDLATATNVTVVVVGGNNGAEQLEFAEEARNCYGANAYLITNVHNVSDLGKELAKAKPGEIAKLVIGGHGCPGRVWFDKDDESRFDADSVRSDDAAKDKIKAALKAGGVLELQGCSCGKAAAGMRMLANLLSVSVKGAKQDIDYFDDAGADWVIVQPD